MSIYTVRSVKGTELTETEHDTNHLLAVPRILNIAELRTNAGDIDEQTVFVTGYYSQGDGGGGEFYWDALNTSAENGGTIIQATGVPTGRWIRIYSGAVDVRWFGAKADGITDDTQSFINANSLNANVRIKKASSNYMTSGITITNPIEFIIDKGAVIRLIDGSDSNLITIAAVGAKISGGTLDANGANQATNGNGIICGEGSTVTGTEILNARLYPIYSNNKSDITIENCDISTANEETATYVFIEATTTSISNIKVINNKLNKSNQTPATCSGSAIKIKGTGAKIRNVLISKNTCILPVNTTLQSTMCIETSTDVNNAIISDNITSGGFMGISLATSNHSSVIGNTIYNPATYGIEIGDSDYFSVSGNSIDCNGLAVRGIATTSNSKSVKNGVISSNTIYNPANFGIQLNGTVGGAIAENISINGNTINTLAANRCIQITASKGISISGNTLDGNGIGTKAIALTNCNSQISVTGNTAIGFITNFVFLENTTSITTDFVSISGNNWDTSIAPVASSLSGGGALGENIVVKGNTGFTFNTFEYINFRDDVKIISRAGSPEGVVSAGVGSKATNSTGGSGTSFYIKESGSGNTGWVGK